jgi:hypothetical protein
MLIRVITREKHLWQQLGLPPVMKEMRMRTMRMTRMMKMNIIGILAK